MSESISTRTNPGRSVVLESSSGVFMAINRNTPTGCSMTLHAPGGHASNRELEAMMRGIADVLGFEIGVQHEV